MLQLLRRAACSAGLLALASCGTTRSGHYWGETATISPTKEAFAAAIRNAASDPWTWAPLAGAAVLSIDDLDEDLSDWARERTPVFGSAEDADHASDDLRSLSHAAWLVSMLATPSGEQLDVWAINKLQGVSVEWAGVLATSKLVSGLKSATERERPDGSDQRSMPSGHASAASAYASLAWRNVDQIEMPGELRWSLRGGLLVFAGGTAWARVEAGRHFPTDVLVGAALGNFVTGFIHDAFLGPASPMRLTAYADPERGDWSVGVVWSW